MQLNSNMKRSTNGRWGVALVGNASEAELERPIQGSITHLGEVAGLDGLR